MNLLAWLLSLTLLVAVFIQAVAFHRATVCRQKAWLKGAELKTRTLLHDPPQSDQTMDIGCRLYVKRKEKRISWQRLPSFNKHEFVLDLRGKL